MRLVVSGYYGFGNAGDEAILSAVLAAFRGRDARLELIVISGDPAATRSQHHVTAVGRGLLPTIRALRRADGLVSGGGALLQDQTSTRSLLYYAGVMLLAAVLRRPVFVYALGIGPIRGRLGRWVAGLALRRASYVSVRDKPSMEAARALGVGRTVTLVPDPAIALGHAGVDPPAASARPWLVVALRPTPGWIRVEPGLVEALTELSASHRLGFVTMQPSIDRPIAARLVARLPSGAEVLEWTDVPGLLSVIGSAELVVGMRLHALVLAAAAGVPFVAISYDPKVEAFAAAVGQPVAGSVAEPMRGDDLAALIRRHLGADHAPYREAVSAQIEQADRPAAGILEAIGSRNG